jgi:hypothetical protein
VLGEDEAAAARVAGANLAELAQLRVELAMRAPVEGKSLHGVIEAVRDAGKYGPPVSR